VAKAAPELLRTLIYCSPPEWAANQHPPSSAMHPDKRRLGTMAALMTRAPEATPAAAISHMFTEHVDVSQRLLVLDALAASAHELAGRPILQPLTAPGTNAFMAPVMHCSVAAAADSSDFISEYSLDSMINSKRNNLNAIWPEVEL
jgi:hypothetical protein